MLLKTKTKFALGHVSFRWCCVVVVFCMFLVYVKVSWCGSVFMWVGRYVVLSCDGSCDAVVSSDIIS